MHIGGDEVLHPEHLVDRLTMDQINGWRQFYLRNPFGAYRADLRQLVLIHYLMASNGGGSGEPPHPVYPYLDNEEDLAVLLDYYLSLPEREADANQQAPEN